MGAERKALAGALPAFGSTLTEVYSTGNPRTALLRARQTVSGQKVPP
jgi:hypothetical protein